MVSEEKYYQMKRSKTIKVVALLYSIVFCALLFSGYFLLIQNNPFLGAGAGVVFALIAWNLARFLGSEERGIQKHIPLFLFLLVISAVGVFNTLMLNLEGRVIFREAVVESGQRFGQVRSAANKYMTNPETEDKIAKVNSLTELLIKEIRNPLNCGQGPEAREIMDQLREYLPTFRPLSTKAIDCSKNDALEANYKSTIAKLVAEAPWYVASNYGTLVAERQSVLEIAAKGTADLRGLLGEVNNGFSATLPEKVGPKLRLLDSEYRSGVERLKRFSTAESVPQSLDLNSVENLGQWSQLVNLFIARADRPQTYVYLLLAVFADWLMVYLFALARAHSRFLPLGGRSSSSIPDTLRVVS